MKIEIHPNWFEKLTEMGVGLERYLGIRSRTIMNSRGYAQLRIHGEMDFKKLKLFSLDNGLPYMTRKWDSINLNLNHICPKYKVRDNFELIGRMLSSGSSWVDVNRVVGMSCISGLKRSYKKLKNIIDIPRNQCILPHLPTH